MPLLALASLALQTLTHGHTDSRQTYESYHRNRKSHAPRTGAQQAKQQTQYEFKGPPGAAILMLCLPLVIYGLYFACNADQCISLNPFNPHFLHAAKNPFAGHTPMSFFKQYLYSRDAIVVYLAWFALQVVLYYNPLGKRVDGVALDAKGTRLKYPLNGQAAGWLSIALVCGLAYAGIISPTIGYDQFTQLAFTAIVFSTLLAVYLYAASLYSSRDNGRHLTPETQLAPHGHTGNVLYDFFIGRTLNPRIGALDLKYMCELRPGLILWALLNLSMACAQYQKHGFLTNSMIVVCLFQGFYVWDALASEQAILTTMDITTDGFGWMLAFGDLAWVPFTYCTQARYLVDHPLKLAPWQMFIVVMIKMIGFWIFRGANGQKNEFRSNPTSPAVRDLEYIQTSTGSKLLISGWWGYARHLNYLGDLMMGLAWCLPTGFGSVIPYFYFVYFTTLLVHRERRDEEKCHKKYGKDWEQYCSIVKYRILPFVY